MWYNGMSSIKLIISAAVVSYLGMVAQCYQTI